MMLPDYRTVCLPLSALPEYALLKLKRGEDRRVRAGHPWIFSNEVDNSATPLSAMKIGAVVQVQSDRGEFLGFAYTNPHALICARILGRDVSRTPDRAWLIQRLKAAQSLRQRLNSEPYYRVVFGESDNLPGLVLDRFGDLIVGQIATAGMQVLKPEVEAAVAEVLKPATLFWKNDSSARDLEQLPHTAEAAFGAAASEIQVIEHGLHFTAPLREGQKTGWFYDQTANRQRLLRYMWPGARILDVCSYVGAWAITALRSGASAASCVDSSENALGFAQRNAEANEVSLETMRGDAFDVSMC
jgi:23S rRNA (cytosine1962-C5)-methyltransferase